MKTLVIAEHNNKTLRPTTLSTLNAARQVSDDIDVLVIGYQCGSVVDALKQYAQIGSIKVADNEAYQHQLVENVAELIQSVSDDYSHIMMPATSFGKNSLPRVAGLLGVEHISDIIAVIDEATFKRPIYAGNAIQTIKSLDAKKLITVRPSAFDVIDSQPGEIDVVQIDSVFTNTLSTYVDETLSSSERPELASAGIVISGGRGLGDKETFIRLEKIADKLGAALGASRAAVDGGLAPNELQVGQTGQIVSPALYIAVGISGAIQHLAGMKDSKIVVAINKDPDAPIFEIADYGLVADLETILPEWEAYLSL